MPSLDQGAKDLIYKLCIYRKYRPKCECGSFHAKVSFLFFYVFGGENVLTSQQILDHVYAHLLVVEILYCKQESKYFVQMGDTMESLFINF